MNKFMIPAIVFGGGITGLAICRNLGVSGVAVNFVVDGIDAAIFSKFCKKHFLIPSFRKRKSLIRLFLKKFSEKTSLKAVIFATDDVSTLLLSELQSEMEREFFFLVPSLRAAEELVIKKKFYESLIENNISHPRVIISSSQEDIEKASKELQYPILIKPSISQYFQRVFRKKGFIANSHSELIKYCDLASKHKIEILLQEVIPGSDKNICGIAGYFNSKSRPLALFAYRRIRAWPKMFGTSSLVESVAISKYAHLKEIVTEYMKRISYSGVMETEFKLDPRDNEFKLIEINARSWWQNSLPTKCGLNIILKAYLDAIGEEVEYSEEYTAGIKWINFFNDMRSSISSLEVFSEDWINSYKNLRDWAMFDIHDPFPSAVSILREIRKLRSF